MPPIFLYKIWLIHKIYLTLHGILLYLLKKEQN